MEWKDCMESFLVQSKVVHQTMRMTLVSCHHKFRFQIGGHGYTIEGHLVPLLTIRTPFSTNYLLCRTLMHYLVWPHSHFRTQGTQYWEGVLDIASIFMDDQGRQAAIKHLSDGPSQCRSARKIFLGRKYGISDWLAPAFRSLILTNPHDLTPDDIRDLDIHNYQTYLQITCIRSNIVRWQREKLLRVPEAHHEASNCPIGRRGRCDQAWLTQYRLSLIPLNHPTNNIPAERVLARMEQDAGPEQMGIGCWTHSVAALRNLTDFTGHCDGIIDQGVASLLQL